MPSEKELEKLEQRFGAFARATFEYKTISPGFAGWVKKLAKRRGEIILVVPRGNSKILLHTKPHYPANCYRLPTGGIHPDELATDAAVREGYEELGFELEDPKLLGVLDNVFWWKGVSFRYPSFVFQTQEFTGKLTPTDPDELISGFRDVSVAELDAAAKALVRLPLQWREWGIFRAAAHGWLVEYFGARPLEQ